MTEKTELTQAAAEDASRPKRGPGRPPKKQPAPVLEKRGVVLNPSDPSNRLELTYSDPSMVKSLFAYFNNLKAVNIYMRCSRDKITFFTRDGGGANRVTAEIPGAQMNHFYCDGEFWLGLHRENVERIFSSIDKSFYKITFLHRHDDPDTLEVIFKDADINKECRYKISVSTLDRDEELFAAESLTGPKTLAKSPLHFRLSAKQFKKTVSDSVNLTSTLTFEKLGLSPLRFSYEQVGLHYKEIYNSPDLIDLHSAVGKETAFRRTVALANIKSLATAMVTDSVRIMFIRDKYIVLRSEVEALVLNTVVLSE